MMRLVTYIPIMWLGDLPMMRLGDSMMKLSIQIMTHMMRVFLTVYTLLYHPE